LSYIRKFICSMLVLSIFSFFTSCASYRVVRVVQLTEQGTGKSDVFYGIAKNNVLLPEFVLDSQNRYPTSKEEAWNRFQSKRLEIEPKINQKYRIPNSFLFQTERTLVAIGLVAISPVALPLHYISGYGKNSEGKRSFIKTVSNYFDLALNNIIDDKTVLKDPLIDI